jgi:hypothetical protein
MPTSHVRFKFSGHAREQSPSSETKASLRSRRELLVPALVLTWTSTDVYILCPFSSCQHVHRHGYTAPGEWILNSRLSHCQSTQQDYRLLFPFEDDPVVRGFGVEVDREQCVWRTVSETLEDPRVEEEDMGSLQAQLAATKISTTLDQKYKLDHSLKDEE